jgi:hypothetical protein
MQAVMQPRIVKISAASVASKTAQSKTSARVTPKTNVGRRFLDFLMLALATPAA